ncbi:probable serine/threonine-protein kinase nek3 isoform X2 [Bactrocera dorsalis]|uniref:Probable serine/threonine-protein kinase nek3 isoform X2 n=1 Tax=Bactrocera dorsalis TaxID=27457 RepID=A0ABM3JW25_BACDO|nr:probable serine/threonine-protein kinase nek3 isoform X2 [Bactrocera dorsalis]
MSCISSNFSSFFLNSLNDSSEFAKYLSNGELKFSPFEDFQVFGSGAGAGTSPAPPSPAAAAAASSSSLTAQQAATQQQQQQQYYNGGVGNSGNTNNNANLSAGANTTGLPSGIEQPYNNGVAAMNSIGNCGGTETANTSALTPANASNTAPAGVQQLQHGAHLHAAHHTPQHPNTHLPHHPHPHPHAQHPYAGHAPHTPGSLAAPSNAFHSHNHLASPHLTSAATTPNYPTTPQRWTTAAGASPMVSAASGTPHPITQLQNSNQSGTPIAANPSGAQHFDGSFEFLKYLRHSNDYNNSEPQGDAAAGSASAGQAPASTSSSSSLIDLDSSTSHKSRSSRKAAALLSSVSRTSNSLDANALDVFDHDSKHTIFDMHHMTATNSSNSNESSMEVSNLAFPSSHLNASNSNTSSEGAATGSSDFAMLHSSSAASAPKPLATFTIKDNFDVHPSHKVEEGIFQHMNKLPAKKKENLKQLGVRFTGQMTLSDKSIVVENFIKFCQEYDVQDHRPFLSLNQSGLNKADQIKFARYLGQGLPTFTLFCIYSNFKNLFCTKRTEIYTKDGYNLPYILDKTKRFLSNTTADLKNMVHQQSSDGMDFGPNAGGGLDGVGGGARVGSGFDALPARCIMPKVLENLMIYENFDVHETHRVEDGVCTHITRLPPKKQEIFKQFGIQSNQTVTFYEKYIIVENFSKFCNEYKISDHRPFLDFHESGLPKCEQVKFVRYLGQGLPNLTLNKIYLSFKDLLGMNRIEKTTADGYNLDMILKKKKKNLYNRMQAAVHRESSEPAPPTQANNTQPTTAQPKHLDGFKT